MLSSSFDQFLDLRGVKCPMAFVKARLFLDECESEEIIAILIDDTNSNEPLPRSLETLGHQILSIDKADKLEDIQELRPHDNSLLLKTSLSVLLIKVQVKK